MFRKYVSRSAAIAMMAVSIPVGLLVWILCGQHATLMPGESKHPRTNTSTTSAPMESNFPGETIENTNDVSWAEAQARAEREGLVTVRQTPHMDAAYDGPLKPRSAIDVKVYTDALPVRPEETSNPILMQVPRKTDVVSVTVWLGVSDEFEVVGGDSRTLQINIKEMKSAEAVEFKVMVNSNARPTANALLAAYFAYRGQPCGKVCRRVIIGGGEQGSDKLTEPSDKAVTGELTINASPQQPDMTVTIEDVACNQQDYDCTVVAPALKKFQAPGNKAKWHLKATAFSIVNQDMKEFTDSAQDPQSKRFSLIGDGVQLFRDSPTNFQEAYWELVDIDQPPSTIKIVSEEPYIPWELMVPYRSGDQETNELPLGAMYSMARWLPTNFTSPVCGAIPLRTSAVLAPDYAAHHPNMVLTNQAEEVQFITNTFPGKQINPAGLISEVDAFFAGYQCDLFHFVGHGRAAGDPSDPQSTPGKQVIILEAEHGWIDSGQLFAMSRFKAFLRTSTPFVFLNACEVGQLGPGLIGVAGFPKSFIDLHARAVVAPLWSVNDWVAKKVAHDFYSRVMENPNTRFAEIVRDIRRRAYEGDNTAGEETYAAYCYYGDPFAHRAPKPHKSSDTNALVDLGRWSR